MAEKNLPECVASNRCREGEQGEWKHPDKVFLKEEVGSPDGDNYVLHGCLQCGLVIYELVRN